MSELLKIMAVVCHPADAIDHAGGTFCLHSDRGDEVTVVVCTHGVDTHDLERRDMLQAGDKAAEMDQETAIGRKEKEVVDGLAILGVTDVRFLRFPDELLIVSPELIEALAEVLVDVQPHLLITHNPTEEAGFGDVGHADSAMATLKAVHLANASPRFQERRTGRRFPAQTFFTTMYGGTTQLNHEGMRYGNVVLDITPVVDRKVRAMDCLRSQYYTGDLGRKCVEITNGRMGLHLCLSYAESYQTLHPHIFSHLPANEHLMKGAITSTKDRQGGLRIMVNDVPVDSGG